MSTEPRDPATVPRNDPVRLHERERIETQLRKMHKLLNDDDKLPPWVCAALYVMDMDDPLNADVRERALRQGALLWNKMHPDQQVPVPAEAAS